MSLEDLLPAPPAPSASYRLGTITATNPLRVQLDGDSAATASTPMSTVNAYVGDRVLVLFNNRRMIIIGIIGGDSVQPGTIHEYAGSTAPVGYLMADGSAVSRTTYARLFAVIGTTFGVGDGSTTFNLPNRKGRVGVGLDSGQTEFDTLGETGGAKTHTLTVGEMPAHTHDLNGAGATTSWPINNNALEHLDPGWGSTGWPQVTQITGVTATGGGGAHNNLQPYLVINYIIKV